MGAVEMRALESTGWLTLKLIILAKAVSLIGYRRPDLTELVVKIDCLPIRTDCCIFASFA